MQRQAPSVPLPRRTPDTQPFWEGCQSGKLLISRCAACGLHHFSREAACPACGSTALDWVKSRGKGYLYSFVICHNPDPYQGTPGIIAIIQLDEGPRIMSPLVWPERGLDNLKVGIRVEVVFDPPGDDEVRAFSFRRASSLSDGR